ncbi:major facilitator superfamily domain-containing protein [Chytriomyces sp. MP71]|nr:major facilitator superfamily domain-containing protein [Chytriomyces sp. MP71]
MMMALLASLGSTALFATGRSIAVLAIARLLQGFACNGAWVIGLSLMADFYKDDPANIGKAMNAIEMGYVTGQLLGPPIGGYLYTLNYYAPFGLCGVLILIDLLGRALLPDPDASYPSSHEVNKGGQESDLPSSAAVQSECQTTEATQIDVIVSKNATSMGVAKLTEINVADPCPNMEAIQFKNIVRFKSLWIVLFLAAALYTVFNGIEPTLPLYLNATYGFDPSRIGIVWMSLVIPQIISSFVGAWIFDRFGMKRAFMVGFITACVAFFVLAIPFARGDLDWTVVTFVFAGISMGLGIAPVSPAIAASVPPEFTTLGYCLMMVVFASGMVVGPIMGSYLFEETGWSLQMLVFGCVLSVSTVALFWLPSDVQK